MTTKTYARLLVLVLAGTVILAVAVETARGHPGDRARVVHMVYTEFGRTPLAACFVEIIDRETGGTFYPRAANWHDRHSDGSRGSFGLAQIASVHRRPGETVAHFARRMYQPRQNLRIAHQLYDRHGFDPWGGFCR